MSASLQENSNTSIGDHPWVQQFFILLSSFKPPPKLVCQQLMRTLGKTEYLDLFRSGFRLEFNAETTLDNLLVDDPWSNWDGCTPWPSYLRDSYLLLYLPSQFNLVGLVWSEFIWFINALYQVPGAHLSVEIYTFWSEVLIKIDMDLTLLVVWRSLKTWLFMKTFCKGWFKPLWILWICSFFVPIHFCQLCYLYSFYFCLVCIFLDFNAFYFWISQSC